MPVVTIPPPYRGPTQGRQSIEVAGRSVRECIEAVDAQHPGFSAQIFDPKGAVHAFVTLFVNGEEIARDAVDTAVASGDEVNVLAAIAGG